MKHSGIAEDAIEARRLASPINHVARGKPPILILASETDVSAPLPNAERMCKRMSEAGHEFEFENWPEEVGTKNCLRDRITYSSHAADDSRCLLLSSTGAYADHRPGHSTDIEVFAGAFWRDGPGTAGKALAGSGDAGLKIIHDLCCVLHLREAIY